MPSLTQRAHTPGLLSWNVQHCPFRWAHSAAALYARLFRALFLACASVAFFVEMGVARRLEKMNRTATTARPFLTGSHSYRRDVSPVMSLWAFSRTRRRNSLKFFLSDSGASSIPCNSGTGISLSGWSCHDCRNPNNCWLYTLGNFKY